MDNVYEISLLIDFYGYLLTGRQYEILDLHYNNDLSLGEIAEQLNITRQGVHDNIKRARATLNGYENKLHLVKRFSDQKTRVYKLLDSIRSIDKNGLKDNDAKKLEKIEHEILDIFNVN